MHFVGVFVFPMSDESAFESFLPVIMNFGEVFDVEKELVEVVG